MPAWIYVLAGFLVLCALLVRFVGRKGTHAAPRGLTPDVHDLTVPVATTALGPPWEAPDPFEGYPDWARPEAPRWAVGGANSGATGYSLDHEPPEPTRMATDTDVQLAMPSEHWLDDQLGDLFAWVRACYAA